MISKIYSWIKHQKERVQAFNAKRELTAHADPLNKVAKNLRAKELVGLLYSDRWERFFWTKQVKKEFEQLAEAVQEQRPVVVVEIGTNTGGTLFAFTKLAAANAIIISIDLPGGKGGGGYLDYKIDFFKTFGGKNQQLFFLRDDSHLNSTKTLLQKILDGREIDFLFLDGDHSYEGIKSDFEMYSPLVKGGGMIAFHDIKIYPRDHWIKVGEFWNEVKQKYNHCEFIETSVHWGGIGILTYEK